MGFYRKAPEPPRGDAKKQKSPANRAFSIQATP
jgi:hypothetical protein